ncbi:MAG TPA: asparagine synthase (glutamine-hydrolyzing), partial [Chitinispirillaceae bacterium]|nr:asparagine synthase (glutamine-hydrolyzing) [Chitinispirillaceae bacterium]
MCGIAGFFKKVPNSTDTAIIIERMVTSLNHRGPDENGFYTDDSVCMGMSRLSIIDLSGGKQPIHNGRKTVWVVFNGEIYNYIELREMLEKKGHSFYTTSDTEVIPHLYDEYGLDFITQMNGNFAIALWDTEKNQFLLIRDRVGIRPLYYSVTADAVVFGSEMKALFEYPGIVPEIDPAGLDQIFSLWVNVPPRTVFKQVNELAPGHFLIITPDGISQKQYWAHTFPRMGEFEDKPIEYYSERLHELLYDATAIRLRADVPVASYLSGGIDSSIISSLVKRHHNNDLITFSIAFADAEFDERTYQQLMAKHLGTDHRMVEATYQSISNAFVDVVRFAEKPTIRTAPAPLFLLSKLVRENNIKVVLTGEGADEVFGGYDIFKEDKIRRFWAKFPESQLRPTLLSATNPFIQRAKGAFWQAFFKKGLTDTNNPYYSHLIRWNNTAQIKRLFHPDLLAQCNEQENVYDALDAYVSPDLMKWHPLCRAQYLECTLFMSGYLLSTQGDRMMMGNSVEGRFPFLDYRVMEFAATIPPELKINGLKEKYLLKKTFGDYVPESVINRVKQPYRAPIHRCFIGNEASALNSSMLSKEYLSRYGYFN